ncbi:S8 family peptidase [Flavobacterium sp. CYK-55]|uniref:S8 family peptidase n=1 Tax=Flavobacterium sp. CYK-55 TaxID=2835529 RepID=UPI001BCF1D86|nr:S8 family peptidase [Flavobacterium sp. CYK-55]MBS7786184.1 S8 family peptidase [Flavobacterium sp. CYK-55]
MALYKHFFIQGNINSEKYRAPSTMGAKPRIPVRDRSAQSQKLLNQFAEIWQQKNQMQEQRSAEQITTREGTYIQFTSAADNDLISKSLESMRGKKSEKWIRLLNIKTELSEQNQIITKAIIYVPNGKEGHFIKKIQDYQNKNFRDTENPLNADLVNSIEDISIALLEGLWTDNPKLIPTDSAKWCEVWLNVNTKDNQEKEQIAQFLRTLESIGIEYKHNSIVFPERTVLLVNANREQLIELMLQSDLLAEFRAGQEPAGFWVNESRIEQQAWVDDLLHRIQIVDSNVKVCLLDTGVNNGHQLLQPLIDNNNTLTVDNSWGTNDHANGSGHGTLMAGVAGYGQMEQVLTSTNTVPLTHQLCSVKILPNQGQSPRELWGDITSQGISIAEIQNPNMVLVYCMAVTSQDDTDRGRPSSWSGAVDNLAYGEGESQRLIIISAGNVTDEEMWQNYPNSNFTSSIQNPAQAWNALVAGAYTNKIQTSDPNFQNYKPVANEGQLSPYSSTSLVWEKKWPIKPDLVFEGGNLLKAPDNSISRHEEMELLSTSKQFNTRSHFDTIWATSAATAKASWFAAKIAYEYPNAWVETIRGLMVHSANWNEAMFHQLNIRKTKKGDYINLLRTFGYGIPDLDRALYSQESALTYIAQETIQPFNYKIKDGKKTNDSETNEIHFFNLPWASDLLLQMGETPVKLKVTLSYFIEPGAGEIGWKDKYRYQSHGLRFDVNNVNESEDDFRRRVNIAAREENEEVNGTAGSNRWTIGTNNRSTGSIHSDYWEGTAAALATSNHIAVYPVIGWWRERKHIGKVENQTRYSLIISLETPTEDVELYTTVKNMIEIPIEINMR